MTLSGSPCRGFALGGGDAYCIAHSSDPSRIEVRESGRARGGEATRKPRLADVLRERVEAEAEKIIAVYVEALDDKDPRVRLQAADSLMSRVYGKPNTRSEVVTRQGLTLEKLLMADPLALGLDSE